MSRIGKRVKYTCLIPQCSMHSQRGRSYFGTIVNDTPSVPRTEEGESRLELIGESEVV